MHGAWMATVPYFQGVDALTGQAWQVSDQFRVSISLSITSAVYAPFEPIYQPEDLASALLVVERGLVWTGSMKLHRMGGVFGEDVFLNEDDDKLRGESAHALTHAMVGFTS
jgi:hypothetical protein